MSNPLRRFLGAGSLYTVATVAPILALLAATPLVTRILGADSYGQVAVAISIYQFSSVLFGCGLGAAITRHALIEATGFTGASGLVLAGSAIAVVLGAAGAAAAPLWADTVFPGVDPAVVASASVAGAGLAIVTLAQSLLRAAERVGTYIALAGAAALVPPVLGLVLIQTLPRSPEMYAIALAIGYGAVAVVSIVVAVRYARPHIRFSILRRALMIGAPTVPHSLSVPLLLTIAMSIVLQAHGLAAAGRLQVAVMLGASIVTILNAVNNAWAPMVMKAADGTRQRLLADSTFVVATIALALICGYVLVGPAVVMFVGGPLITDDGPVRASMVIALAGVFHVLYLANIHLTFLSGRTWPLALLTPLSAVIALTMLWLLTHAVPAGEIMLIAAAWPVFYALQALFSHLLARRSPYPPASARWAAVPLLLGAGVAGQAFLLQPQPLLSLGVVFAAAAIAAGSVLRFRRHLSETHATG